VSSLGLPWTRGWSAHCSQASWAGRPRSRAGLGRTLGGAAAPRGVLSLLPPRPRPSSEAGRGHGEARLFWSQRLDAGGRRRGAENKGYRSASLAREGTMGRCEDADRLLGGLLWGGAVEDVVQECPGELDRPEKRALNRFTSRAVKNLPPQRRGYLPQKSKPKLLSVTQLFLPHGFSRGTQDHVAPAHL